MKTLIVCSNKKNALASIQKKNEFYEPLNYYWFEKIIINPNFLFFQFFGENPLDIKVNLRDEYIVELFNEEILKNESIIQFNLIKFISKKYNPQNERSFLIKDCKKIELVTIPDVEHLITKQNIYFKISTS